ncbi:hypothetical protein LTR53_005592 [Teratosphaeriaceae sp. CCFEE 6253]|nr:hypothetical protein LTR53_005592 [Teratosphaeriaceae sp. CCFEE 6253]
MAYSTSSRTGSQDYFGDSDGVSTKASSVTMPKYNKPDERTHLLSDSPREGFLHNLPTTPPRWLTQQRLVYLLMLIVVVVGAGDQIIESPQTRIFESIICYRYYEEADPSKLLAGRGSVGPGAIGGVLESDCKVNVVQEQLAMLRGYQQLLDGFPSLLLALPFGWAADKFGRKPFLALGLVSFALRYAWIQLVCWWWQSFDIRMTWLSTLHGIMSGGSGVVSGMFFVVLSDITSEADRASVFLRVGGSSLLSNLLLPPISAWLMRINPWIPNLIGLLIYVVSLFSLPFVPETLNYRRSPAADSSLPPTPSVETAPARPSTPKASEPSPPHPLARLRGQAASAISFLSQDWRVAVLIVPFIAHMLLGMSSQLLIQYMSKRYGISFSDATLLLTVYNGVRVALLFVILPYLSTHLLRTLGWSVPVKDLYLTRLSMFFMLAGFVLIAMSPSAWTVAISLAIASLGSGAYLVLRSFIASLVPAHHIARLFSTITLIDTLGSMFGSALLAGLFKRGLVLGGGWIGLPFYFIGLISAAFAAMLFTVRLRPGESGDKLADDAPDEL